MAGSTSSPEAASTSSACGPIRRAENETSDDRDQIDDKFHVEARFAHPVQEGRATVSPGMNYRFGYGADIEFCCIDTTETPGGMRGEHFFQDPRHRNFLRNAFPEADTGPDWRIPLHHHPPYCAGPQHGNTQTMLEHLVPMYRQAGVRASFAGHEHNFQVSRADGILHVITGARGKIQEMPPSGFEAARTEAFGMQAHCLLVQVTDDRMFVTPLSGIGPVGDIEVMSALGPDMGVVLPPFVVARP